MTIIASCLTHDYVVQVSDRRVVWILPNNTIIAKDDDRNKAIDFCHRMAFGYTGLAELEGKKTDNWLTETLSNLPRQSVDTAVEIISTRATEVFRHIHNLDSRTKRHAFVGVGWAIPLGEKDYQPLFVSISNYQGDKGKPLPEAKPVFDVNVDFLKDADKGAISIVGKPLDRDLYNNLRRNLRKCTRKNLSPLPAIQSLAIAIRSMAKRYEEVGSNLMALSIPKATLQIDSPFYINSPSTKNNHTFLYLPSGKEIITYGPNFVCGRSSLTDYQVKTEGTKQEVSVKISRPE